MRRFVGLAVGRLLAPMIGPARADDKDAKAILDKAIKALGGEEKLGKAEVFSWKAKGTSSSTATTTSQQPGDRQGPRSLSAGSSATTSSRAWSSSTATRAGASSATTSMELEGDAARQREAERLPPGRPDHARAAQGQGLQGRGRRRGEGRRQAGRRPQGHRARRQGLHALFDKESGLPVKQVARVVGFQGEEYTQETTFADYKDFGGIKKATKVESQARRRAVPGQELTEFKVLDKVDADTFAEPK